MTKPDLLLTGPLPPPLRARLDAAFEVHDLTAAADRATLLAGVAPKVKAIAVVGVALPIDSGLMESMPALEIASNFGVGYDLIDAAWAGRNGVTVTNTPGVLDDEVADVTIGLLIATLREFPQAERYLRAGRWLERPYPLTRGTLRGRRVGILGLGRIGKAIAARLEPFGVEIAYHGRTRQQDVRWRYVPTLLQLARESDVLIVIAPATPETRNIVDSEVLKALGSEGVLINMARGSLVDEPALIEALADGTILAAGLDVFAQEPMVPQALLDLPNAVLLPHVGSASVHTRFLMGQLMVDNLVAWAEGRPPLTPVPETPWPPAVVRAAT